MRYFYCAFRYANESTYQYKFLYAPTMLSALSRFTGRDIHAIEIEDITDTYIEYFEETYYYGRYSM